MGQLTVRWVPPMGQLLSSALDKVNEAPRLGAAAFQQGGDT